MKNYVYLNAKTGEKIGSETPITSKHYILIRQKGRVIVKNRTKK